MKLAEKLWSFLEMHSLYLTPSAVYFVDGWKFGFMLVFLCLWNCHCHLSVALSCTLCLVRLISVYFWLNSKLLLATFHHLCITIRCEVHLHYWVVLQRSSNNTSNQRPMVFTGRIIIFQGGSMNWDIRVRSLVFFNRILQLLVWEDFRLPLLWA